MLTNTQLHVRPQRHLRIRRSRIILRRDLHALIATAKQSGQKRRDEFLIKHMINKAHARRRVDAGRPINSTRWKGRVLDAKWRFPDMVELGEDVWHLGGVGMVICVCGRWAGGGCARCMLATTCVCLEESCIVWRLSKT